jgi:hypothetical protein
MQYNSVAVLNVCSKTLVSASFDTALYSESDLLINLVDVDGRDIRSRLMATEGLEQFTTNT